MRTVSDDGETQVREIGRRGLKWTVVTDPAESRWFLGDRVAVMRGYTGWYVNVDGRDVRRYRRHRDALEAAVDAYIRLGDNA
jgi:hypothetical protein